MAYRSGVTSDKHGRLPKLNVAVTIFGARAAAELPQIKENIPSRKGKARKNKATAKARKESMKRAK